MANMKLQLADKLYHCLWEFCFCRTYLSIKGTPGTLLTLSLYIYIWKSHYSHFLSRINIRFVWLSIAPCRW